MGFELTTLASGVSHAFRIANPIDWSVNPAPPASPATSCRAGTLAPGLPSDFRLAYEEAVRALRAQADEHGSLRTRAGTILATSLVVTSFFGGQAVARNAPASSLAWLAVVAFLVAGVFSLGVLFPSDLRFASDVGDVVSLIEHESPAKDAHRELSLSLATRLDSNARRLVAMRWTFRASAVAVLAETVFWIAYLADN